MAGGAPFSPEEDKAVLLSYKQYRESGYTRSYASWARRRSLLRMMGRDGVASIAVEDGSPVPDLNWREVNKQIASVQSYRKKTSYSSDHVRLRVDTNEPIGVIGIGDLHAGAWSTNPQKIEALIDQVLATPNLYVIFLGDLTQMAVKLRSVSEVSDNLLSPEHQFRYIESLITEVADRTLCATWGNHDNEREEMLLGQSRMGHILATLGIPYHSGIGHLDLTVGKQVYKMALSHRFRGGRGSLYNPVMAGQKYITLESPDREIAWAGDSHQPGCAWFRHGDAGLKFALNCGSTQDNSRYAKRYFSLTTHNDYPMVELHSDEHRIVPFYSVDDWVASRG